MPIYPPYLYSAQYEGASDNEFDRLMSQWNDISYIIQFLTENSDYLKNNIWQYVGEVEDLAGQVRDEAEELDDLFIELNENCINGEKPDFDSHFHFLDGKYSYCTEWIPVKTYGTRRPSLIRLYAIKLDDNYYVITGGGIKLAKTIQESPDIKDHVLTEIDMVRDWLKANGIFDSNDIEQ